MARIVHTSMGELSPKTRENDNPYGYTEYPALPAGFARHCKVSFYEIPPGKSNFPYHYHLSQEEVFYIISGEGLLKCPEGEKPFRAGDLIFCPSGAEGAHRLTTTSDSEPLVYLDFDTVAGLDACVYPDSNKVAVWSPTLNKVYRAEDNVDYYDREDAEKQCTSPATS